MKIYVDFDDVLCETGKAFTQIAKELFDMDVAYQEVQFFNLRQSFHLDDAQYDEFMRVGHLPEKLLKYEETPGASETINRWFDEGHEVSIITGRPFDAYEPSRQWLDQHNLARIPLFCVDKYGREEAARNYSFNMTLAQFYDLSFDFVVEDSPAAFEHVLHFDNCRVAIMNRPWNVNVELPNERFVRCDGWKEIDGYFREA